MWSCQFFYVTYATVQLQTFPTRGRTIFYLILSRHLFNSKMTFKASGRGRGGRGGGRGRRRITLAPCKL